ncbi:hypothetical protein [Tsukamurella pulmonis]|uniref:hypothetical protein n=1 Tax=Tsukamurella pulmonis TaxID=47312 RepID=UPI00111368BA|nr:hypothetical protein [Tsukamurella pulmonis]
MSGDTAWDFTRRLSPRSAVRLHGVVDAATQRTGYKQQYRCSAAAPTVPWAVHLTTDRGAGHLFALLAFDFDAHAPAPALQRQYAARADAAARRMAQLLTDCGIEFSVCASGPGGGRHVWVALRDHLPLERVRRLARLARAAFGGAKGPLDIAPLSNATHGLVRPPGAPHPRGGRSEWIGGHPIEVLTVPSTTAAAIDRLMTRLDELVATTAGLSADEAPEASAERRTAGDLDPAPLRRGGPLPIAVDDDGAPWIEGRRRPLPKRQLDRAREPLGADDGSAVVFRLLCSAALASWKLRDVVDELAELPGMEHVRTVRVDGGRVPRSVGGSQSATAVLAADWKRAVTRIATRDLPSTARAAAAREVDENDPGFDAEAGAVADAIAHLEHRAALSCGRWKTRLGGIDRKVLHTLCTIAARANKLTIAAATRTVAEETGCGRESARLSLLRLERDGWIAMVAEAESTNAAVWELCPYGVDYEPPAAEHESAATSEKNTPPTDIHREIISDRSHQPTGGARGDLQGGEASAPPLASGTARRAAALERLALVQDLSRHDCFVPDHRGGLGSRAAWVYANLPADPTPIDAIWIPGLPARLVEHLLEHQLHPAGLVDVTAEGIARADPAARDAYARAMGTAGIGATRAEQYAVEREVWAWWCSAEEQASARAIAPKRGSTDRGRVFIADGQLTLQVGAPVPETAHLPPYPRGRLGRPNHRAAYAYIAARRQQRHAEQHAAA